MLCYFYEGISWLCIKEMDHQTCLKDRLNGIALYGDCKGGTCGDHRHDGKKRCDALQSECFRREKSESRNGGPLIDRYLVPAAPLVDSYLIHAPPPLVDSYFFAASDS